MKIESYFYKMKNVLLVFACLLFITASGQEKDRLANWADSKELKKGTLAFYAQNMSNGITEASYNAEKWVSPASILKLVTTSTAIDIIGADYRFETKIGYAGSVKEGVLNGNVIIKGAGDPSLGFDLVSGKAKFPEKFFTNLINSLQNQGISSIEGDLIVDNSLFTQQAIPGNWAWGDIGNYYGAASYALNFYGNRYSVFFRSGKMEGAPTTVSEVYPRMDLNFNNHVKTANIRNDQAYIYSAPGAKTVYMEGRIPLGESSFEVKGSMPNPSMFFLETLKSQLTSSKITHDGELSVSYSTTPFEQELYSHRSPTLKEICIYTNKFSDNFFAETLLKQIGASRGVGSTNNGIRVLQKFVSERGMNSGNFNITDGSGLSRSNLITAKGMVDLLVKDFKGPGTNFTELGLSISGRSGSLKRVGAKTCIEGKMQAKSGYMNNIRSYAGLYQNSKGENVVFCIVLNNYNCSASKAREIISEILVETFCN